MAVESSKQTGEDEVASLVDDLIRDILNASAGSGETSMQGGMTTTAALFETAFGSPRAASRTSMLERLLLAQTFASELADALAPALAEQLAPRLLKAMDMHMSTEAATEKNASSTRPGGQGRKPGTK